MLLAGPGGQGTDQTHFDEEGRTYCRECGSYLDDAADSTDIGSDWEDAADSQELQAYLGSFEGCTAQSLREDYFLARARFRHYTGRTSRKRRFPKRHGGGSKARGKGGRRTPRRAWRTGGEASPTGTYKGSALGANAFAGGKGKGKAKGKGKNPFDPSGRQMECCRCGSKDHLSSSCHHPKRKGGKGSRKGGGFFEDLSLIHI